MTEKQRQSSKRQELLNLLREKGKEGATNSEMSKVSLRYGGHLGKLYELGYKIKKANLGNGLFRYTLLSEPEPNEEHVVKLSALESLINEVEKEEIIDADMLRNIMKSIGVSVRYNPYTYTQA